jgi:6-phosphogluconolactonase
MKHLKLMLVAAIALGSGMGFAAPMRVYLGTLGKGESKGIYLCELDGDSGVLSEPKLAVEVGSPGFLVPHPGGSYLYSTSRPAGRNAAGRVAAYRIKPDGMLEIINRQSSEGRGPCFVGLDASGKTLLAANYGSGSVAALKVQLDGSLAKSTSFFQHEGSSVNPKRQEGPHAHSIYAGPENKYAYAPDLGIDQVVIYELAPGTATLKPAGVARMPPGSGPRHMKFGKDGKQAYVLSELLLNVVVLDRAESGGGLRQKQVVSVLPEGTDKDGMTCSEILASGDGKFVYTANRDTAGKGRDSLSVLTIRDGGNLTLLQTVPAKVAIPRNITLSPDGKWLLVAGQKSGNVPVFAVGKDGKLSATPHEVKLANAMCVVFGR